MINIHYIHSRHDTVLSLVCGANHIFNITCQLFANSLICNYPRGLEVILSSKLSAHKKFSVCGYSKTLKLKAFCLVITPTDPFASALIDLMHFFTKRPRAHAY